MARSPRQTDQAGERVWLSGHLAEFRTALDEEIDAASRAAAGSTVPLTNGRRIASIGGSYQYAFMVASILQVPDGSPCDLRMPRGQTYQAVIVSIEGLSVTLANRGSTRQSQRCRRQAPRPPGAEWKPRSDLNRRINARTVRRRGQCFG